ncbi:predicted protein, partial [Nematostella vectensis]
LASVDPRKARGPDNIPSAVQKICADELAPSLCVLFNKSLELGKLPAEWKKSLIVPIFKKNRKERVENYRPISLLSVTSKVLERCIFSHMIHHVSQFLSNSPSF